MLLAQAYDMYDKIDKAEYYYKDILSYNPNNIHALVAIEYIVKKLARYDEARYYQNQIRKIDPKLHYTVDLVEGCLDLLEGNWKEGFTKYEKRFDGCISLKNAYNKPLIQRWNKEDLSNKSIIIRKEQGLGDAIQFVRYGKLLKEIGAKIVAIGCHSSLKRLFSNVKVIDIVENNEITNIHKYDYEVMQMSLPYLFNTTIDNAPNNSYLNVKEDDELKWKEKLKKYKRKRIGICWSGDLKLGLGWQLERMNERRSISLNELKPLFELDYDFFSLQKGYIKNDLKHFEIDNSIIDLMDECKDFYDTACLIKNLDLIISVDTSIAHLAGGLGKPIWLLNRLDTDWRWLLNRNDSPWYPTMKIYRQTEYKNWNNVINKVINNLK